MTERQANRTVSDRWSYLWLAIGAILLVFANGQWTIPLAAWLAPVFVIRFLRTQKPARGLILVALAIIVTGAIRALGWMPPTIPPGILRYLMPGVMSLVFLLPFVADRLVAPRLEGLVATLVFPLTWTALEYINAVTTPFGSWGAVAYTQAGNLPLVQIVSLTGIWGLTFLVTWFAPVANWAWEQEFRWPEVRRGVGLYAGILALVLLLGGARLALAPPAAETVRVGAIVRSMALIDQFDEGLEEQDWASTRETSSAMLDDILELSREAVRAGARIVFWQEGPVFVLKEDEAAFVERGKELARQEKIYLGMALATITVDFPADLAENKALWIAPSGDILWEYFKARPVPGEPVVDGEDKVAILDTPYGTIASVICFDMDHPALIRQAGQADADLMLVPTNDWEEAKLMHKQMAVFRAIENGFSLVRATGSGLSAAADYQGRSLAVMDQFATEERLMIADAPTQGTTTLYALIGDLFAWLCLAGSVAVIGRAVARRRA